ncbi:hypothetical protein ACVDG3_03265 [Meridianimarinicoccus sp. RP-17]|uniref:hypothetical protein n=1 Tax=Meridianimarinicoccus zhengii TaxID=2056810 RepID=UPI001C9AD6D8|nr:hypothetical protein [Phycocomes zhengii]
MGQISVEITRYPGQISVEANSTDSSWRGLARSAGQCGHPAAPRKIQWFADTDMLGISMEMVEHFRRHADRKASGQAVLRQVQVRNGGRDHKAAKNGNKNDGKTML